MWHCGLMRAQLIEGPAWAPHRIDLRAGRFPLGVEAHLMQMTAHLVPGATTVTINARYYALHGYVALVADDRGSRWGADIGAVASLRSGGGRCDDREFAQPDSLYAPHGNDFIEPLLAGGDRSISRRCRLPALTAEIRPGS